MRTPHIIFFIYGKKLDQFYLDQSIETVRRIEPDFKWLIETYSDRVPKLAAYASSWICEMGNLIGNKQIVTEWIQYSKKIFIRDQWNYSNGYFNV